MMIHLSHKPISMVLALLILGAAPLARSESIWSQIGEDYQEYRAKVDPVVADPGSAIKEVVREKVQGLGQRPQEKTEDWIPEDVIDFAGRDLDQLSRKTLRSTIRSFATMNQNGIEALVLTYPDIMIDGSMQCVTGLYYLSIEKEGKTKTLPSKARKSEFERYLSQEVIAKNKSIGLKGYLLEKGETFAPMVSNDCLSFHIVIGDKDLQGIIEKLDGEPTSEPTKKTPDAKESTAEILM
ncbi:MAG: hypothetical protein R3A11_09405 [Bdellovibrionota bacterium]